MVNVVRSKEMCSQRITRFFSNHGLSVFHLLQVIILSIGLPLFDFIREWLVISNLYSTRNFAWGSLFLFPVLNSSIAYYVAWYSEEIKRNDIPFKKIGMWKFRTWITLLLAPLYAMLDLVI